MKRIELDPRRHRSLVDPFLERLREDPTREAYVLFGDDEVEQAVTREGLHAAAMAWASRLLQAGVNAGDVVIIALRHSRALVESTWGAFFRGAVPSLLAAPGPMASGEAYGQRLVECARAAGAQAIVAPPDLASPLAQALAGTGVRVITPPAVAAAPVTAGPAAVPGAGEDIAYLQFTSGSTGQRKGVQLSHRAILAWMGSLTRSLPIFPSDSQVSWLPLYHDFGLFMGLLVPLSLGLTTVLISPFKWLRKPVVQLQSIHRHQASLSFLPNSGLNHLLRGVADRELPSFTLDTLDFLLNGSEPIYHRSQELFLQRFAPRGLRETALATGYGMAETTLAASISNRGERSRLDWIDGPALTRSQRATASRPHETGAVQMVGSGRPLAGMEVVVADERGCRLPERVVGEIIVRGPALFSGYRGRPDLDREVLRDGWYFSGDLGYMAAGELFVTGRKKDLIIVGGQNVHPEDIEAAAIELLAVDPGRAVSFGIPDELTGTERVVLVCEMRRELGASERREAEQRLRRRVFSELDIVLGEVRFMDRNWIVKTVNGKLARGLSREKFLSEATGANG